MRGFGQAPPIPITACATRFHVDRLPSRTLLAPPTRREHHELLATRAQMAELVDAPASGAGARKGVEVRVLFWAPFTHSSQFADG